MLHDHALYLFRASFKAIITFSASFPFSLTQVSAITFLALKNELSVLQGSYEAFFLTHDFNLLTSNIEVYSWFLLGLASFGLIGTWATGQHRIHGCLCLVSPFINLTYSFYLLTLLWSLYAYSCRWWSMSWWLVLLGMHWELKISLITCTWLNTMPQRYGTLCKKR